MQSDAQTRAFRRAVDCINAAAVNQATWTDVSRHACEALGADAAALIAWRTRDHQVLAMDGVGQDPALVRDYETHYYKHDVLLDSARFDGEWQVSDEVFPDAQWGNHEFFGMLHRHRVRQVVALTLRLDNDIMAGMSLHRGARGKTKSADFHAGPLRHFTQAACAAFSERYSAAAAVRQSIEELLSSPTAQCLLADAAGCVQWLSATQSFGGLGPLMLVGGRLWHSDPASDARLRRLISQAVAGTRGAISLRGARGVALRIEAQPVPAAAKLIASQALALIRIESRGVGHVPELEDLQSLFGVTRAQAKVLQLLCDGQPPRKCGEQLGCSEATVRTHIAQLMNRMECSTQVQLVGRALLLTR
jgi:DNA-binding CsgD family transcriptional regulator